MNGAEANTALPAAFDLAAEAARGALARWLAGHLPARDVRVAAVVKLGGGAIQDNWALTLEIDGGEFAGAQDWVLRTDAAAAISSSLSRVQEYAVLRVAHDAGVRVAQPLAVCADANAIGRPFFLMRRVAGIAAGHRLTREAALNPQPAALARDLGANLARLHAIRPACAGLKFLSAADAGPALAAIAGYRAYLDTLSEAQPVLEWGLRWCERHATPPHAIALLHRDYRTGNYLVDGGRLAAVLDWEFAGWGDPVEDIGWFSAACWRFAAPDRDAGGIGDLADFLDAYAEIAGWRPERERIVYWQIMAHLRWAVIALQQAQRHICGQQRSLELALTGRLVPDLEWAILDLIEGAGA